MPLTPQGAAVMEVCLEKVRLHGRHGLLEAERKVGNEFELNIRASYTVGSQVADDLSGSLCYAELYELAAKEMTEPSGTLEHLVARIGNAITARWPAVEAVEVSVTKLAPPIPRFRGIAKVTWRRNT